MTLLAEAAAAGLSVGIDGDRLVVRGPKRKADLAARLLAHKAEVVGILAARPTGEKRNAYGSDTQAATLPVESQVVERCGASTGVVANDAARHPLAGRDCGTVPNDAGRTITGGPPRLEMSATTHSHPREARCRCGSSATIDVPIHDGQSVRRDCARCRRFVGFPVWYGIKRA